jgi:eukaryotic-like serine/threonine-protein kinase
MVGAVVGNYRVVREIGAGGMGRVFLAEHTLIGKRAAIKVLLPQYSANTEIVTRFFNEARASSVLKHAGIIDVYDFGRLPDGSAFIVMEFLDGESLNALLTRERRLPLALLLDLARQVANALAVAHERGIVHRDLKPDNIFLVEDTEMRAGLRAKILDFGIAKLTDDVHPGGNGTRTGALIGTPTYMSPEQCRGAGKVDHRTDIYALGCVMFQMATGQPPFLGEGLGDILAGHMFDEPASLTGVLAAPYDALVGRMLAKLPQDRVQTMREVATHLGQAPRAERPAPVAPSSGKLPAETTAHHPSATVFKPTTTLGAANGQVTQPNEPHARRRTPLLIGAVALLVGVGGLTLRSASYDSWKHAPDLHATTETQTLPSRPAIPGTSQPAPTVVSPAALPAAIEATSPTPITVVVSSQPAGADLYRADGVRIGKTPWTAHYPPSAGEAVFMLRLKGYHSTELVAKLDHDRTVSAVLERVSHSPSSTPKASSPAAATTPAAPTAPSTPAKKRNGLAADPFAN